MQNIRDYKREQFNKCFFGNTLTEICINISELNAQTAKSALQEIIYEEYNFYLLLPVINSFVLQKKTIIVNSWMDISFIFCTIFYAFQ